MHDAGDVADLKKVIYSPDEILTPQDTSEICELGRAVVEKEIQAIQLLVKRIDAHFAKACHLLLNCKGRIIVTGIGKSGHIGRKLAATFSSTGSPAFFVHPAEARHGDMGMITQHDVVLAISHSGETEEVLFLLPMIKRLNIALISLTGNTKSTLAKAATLNIDIDVGKEACPLNLAPTSSTTAALVMGDALAISLLQKRGFTAEDFALSHPGGTLCRRILLKVDEIMHTGDMIPRIQENALLKAALIEMSHKKLGMTTVINNNNDLVGIFTDGDLRRVLDKNVDIHKVVINEVMGKNPKVISQGMLAAEALNLMNTYKITSLIVVDEKKSPVGIVHIHDILKAGIS